MMVAWPIILGPIPTHGTKSEKRHYLISSEIYMSVLLLALFATLVCAVYLARQIRQEYREGAEKAMRELIEGTMEDHKRRSQVPEPSE